MIRVTKASAGTQLIYTNIDDDIRNNGRRVRGGWILYFFGEFVKNGNDNWRLHFEIVELMDDLEDQKFTTFWGAKTGILKGNRLFMPQLYALSDLQEIKQVVYNGMDRVFDPDAEIEYY